jgi:hypothetical protein
MREKTGGERWNYGITRLPIWGNSTKEKRELNMRDVNIEGNALGIWNPELNEILLRKALTNTVHSLN